MRMRMRMRRGGGGRAVRDSMGMGKNPWSVKWKHENNKKKKTKKTEK
jgi:hypothetical protein